MSSTLEIVFWGCRGSVSSSDAENVRYGANTTCFEIRSRALDCHVVIDAGTGITRLGRQLSKESDPSIPIHIFYSHSHWDHIQGFPFFSPIYDPRQTIVIHHPAAQDFREILSQQMSPPCFPGTIEAAQAKLIYEPYEEGPIEVGGVYLHPYALRHARDQRSNAFLIGLKGEPPSVALASDRQESRDGSVDAIEQQFDEAITGIDVLVHDAFFTDEDFERHPDWGHSSIRFVIGEAQRLGVKTLCLHHYNPEYDDDAIDTLLEEARQFSAPHPLKITAAVEGERLTWE